MQLLAWIEVPLRKANVSTRVLLVLLNIENRAIFNSQNDPNATVSQPVLQCVQVKPLVGQQGNPERFRVVFSDINNFVQSMLATRELRSKLKLFSKFANIMKRQTMLSTKVD